MEPSGPGTRWLFVVTGPLPSSAKCHMCSWAGGCGSRGAVRPEPRWEAGAGPVRAAVGLGVSRPALTFSPELGTGEDAGEVPEPRSAFLKAPVPQLLSPDPPRSGTGGNSPQPARLGSGRWTLPHTDTPPGGAGTCSPPSMAAEESVSEHCSGPARPPRSPPRHSAALQINSRALNLPLEAPCGLQAQPDQLPQAPSRPGSEGLCHPPPSEGSLSPPCPVTSLPASQSEATSSSGPPPQAPMPGPRGSVGPSEPSSSFRIRRLHWAHGGGCLTK